VDNITFAQSAIIFVASAEDGVIIELLVPSFADAVHEREDFSRIMVSWFLRRFWSGLQAGSTLISMRPVRWL